MNDYDENTPTEDHVADLLSTYADALYEQSVVPDGEAGAIADEPTPDVPIERSNQPAALDVDLQPERTGDSTGKGRMLALVGAAVLAVVVSLGAVALLGSDDTSEVAAEDDAAADTETDDNATIVEDGNDADPAPAAADSAVGEAESIVIEGSSAVDSFVRTTVFHDDEFVSLSSSDSGAIVATFGLGDDATTVATSGLPDGVTWVPAVTRSNDGFVALINQMPDFDPANVSPIDIPSSTFFLATSDDLISWESVEVTGFELAEGNDLFIRDLAVSGDRVVISGQLFADFGPERLLVDAGLLSEEDLFNICSTEWDGTAFVVSTCDFSEEVEPFGDVEQFEDDVTETEVARIEEGDPLFPEVAALLDAQQEAPEVLTVTGPIGGPFELVDSPISGFDTSIAGTPDGFLATGTSDRGVSQAFSSADGLTWIEAESPEGDDGFFGGITLVSQGNTIVAVTQGFETVTASSTTDLGQTWTDVDIPTSLFNSFGMPVAGPAGFAVQLQGTTEPFDDGLVGQDLSLTKEGFTATFNFSSGGASLIGPDGTIIHDDVFIDGVELPNVVRFEGQFDDDLIWLDPETGEDLITFTQEDFVEAFSAQDFDDEEDFVEPETAIETWFSPDGTNWTLIDSSDLETDSFGGISAVGDDEVLTSTEVFAQPPADLLEFEDEFMPTPEESAAIDAWFLEQGNQITYTIISIG